MNEKVGTEDLTICGNFFWPKLQWGKEIMWTGEYTKENSFLKTLRDRYLTQHINEHARITLLTQLSLLYLFLIDVIPTPSSIQYRNPLGKSDHVLIKTDFAIAVDEQTN